MKTDVTYMKIERYTSNESLGFPNVSVVKYNCKGDNLITTNRARPTMMLDRLRKVHLRKQEEDATTGSKRVAMRSSIVYGAEPDGVKWWEN